MLHANEFFQVAEGFNNMVNPLFVLLDDTQISREHLVRVSRWIVMSLYSTWLLFVQKTTSIESYFKDVYVSIDSKFFVSQQSNALSQEEIKCIYHIEMSDLQIEKFASWTEASGLAELTNVLNHKAKDFHGKIIRIGVYDVSLTQYI